LAAGLAALIGGGLSALMSRRDLSDGRGRSWPA
jgi:hypothetical protein